MLGNPAEHLVHDSLMLDEPAAVVVIRISPFVHRLAKIGNHLDRDDRRRMRPVLGQRSSSVEPPDILRDRTSRRIDGVPCLMVSADRDDVLTPAQAVGMDEVIGDLETVVLNGVGHWTQQERPEEVNRLLTDWLDRRFPLGGEG